MESIKSGVKTGLLCPSEFQLLNFCFNDFAVVFIFSASCFQFPVFILLNFAPLELYSFCLLSYSLLKLF
jgi:hypothetical protein